MFLSNNFPNRTYFHFLTLKHLTGSTADTYLEYTQRNLPEGVSMKVIIIMIIIFIIIIVHEGHQARGPEAVPIHRQAAARAGGEYLVTE